MTATINGRSPWQDNGEVDPATAVAEMKAALDALQ